jgi:hypothetical protein
MQHSFEASIAEHLKRHTRPLNGESSVVAGRNRRRQSRVRPDLPAVDGAGVFAVCLRQFQGFADSRARSLKLVQRQPEARDEGVHKVAHFREIKSFDAGSERLLCLRELRITGSDFL